MTEPSRILLDSPPDIDPAPVMDFLGRLAYPVDVCHGPGPGQLCPILSGDGCEKLADAKGIIYHLDLDIPQHREILAEYRRLVPTDVPLRVVVQPGQEETYAELLHGLPVWTHEPTAGDLDGFASLVEAADMTRSDDE